MTANEIKGFRTRLYFFYQYEITLTGAGHFV